MKKEFCKLSLRVPICGLFVVLSMGAWIAAGNTAHAQAIVAGDDESKEENQTNPPFLLPAQPTEIGEAMEDFRRFAGRKQWEKAFKHLEKVFAATSNGLVLTADGIMLPSRMIAREALLELPVAGQDAYRLFFDAEAKKLLEQAQGKEELPKLTQIFARFLVTSVGDTAADRLGDLHFEAGNLSQAVNAWRSIIEQRPDSQIPRAKLRTKILIALARQEYWVEFNELMKVFEQQHADTKMTLGGKEVRAIEHLRAIAEKSKANRAAAVVPTMAGSKSDISLPSDSEPLWQFRFFPTHDPKSGPPPGLMVQNNRWGGQQNNSDYVPAVILDESRVYVNFAGYDLGIDQETGRLLWRSGRIFDVNTKAQNGAISPLEQHGIALGSGRLWTVAQETADQGQPQQQGGKFGFVTRELDTGKKVLNSKNLTELNQWSIRGRPLLGIDRVYLAASPTNNPQQLDVLALNTKTGKLLWSATIGSYTSQSNPYMMERSFQPSLLLNGGHLYVDSHSGSLVQVDAASGQIEWGVNYTSDVTQMQRFWFWGYNQNSDQYTSADPQIVNGVLYLKGMRSRKMYAVDPQRPRVLWHRPVPLSSNIIGVDETCFYLGGDDISAFDLKTRKIIWSVKMNGGTSWAHSLLSQNRIYHFSGRGIFEIDKANGKVVQLFRGSDLESLGGRLFVTPKSLITVSNLAVTAYPLNTAQAVAKPAHATAPTDRKVSEAGKN